MIPIQGFSTSILRQGLTVARFSVDLATLIEVANGNPFIMSERGRVAIPFDFNGHRRIFEQNPDFNVHGQSEYVWQNISIRVIR